MQFYSSVCPAPVAEMKTKQILTRLRLFPNSETGFAANMPDMI